MPIVNKGKEHGPVCDMMREAFGHRAAWLYLLLDEATSALDVATERKVLRKIIRHDPRRTVIVTAHRPSVFAQCNRVYLVGGGQFSEINAEQLQQFLDGEGSTRPAAVCAAP